MSARHIVLAGTDKHAVDRCRELGLPPPPHRRNGERTWVFTVTRPDRLRGFQFRDDDIVHYGYFPSDLSPTQNEEFERNLAVARRALRVHSHDEGAPH